MDIKDIIKQSEIHKAPEGFADKVMFNILDDQKAVHKSHELLSKKQRILVFVLTILILIISYLLSLDSSPAETEIPAFDFAGFLDTMRFKMTSFAPQLNLFLIVSIGSAILLGFMIFDLLFRKSFKVSFQH